MLNTLSTTRIQRWVYAFIFLQILVWTLAPTCIRYTLPMDALEGTTWGQQLEWGYDKNPFVNGWLTALAVKLGGQSGWTTYLFSQLSVALCFLAVWQLGKKILSPLYAFIAVLLLANIQYYNLHAIDFNDNTLELGFWAATILFFYQALCEQKSRDWILTGLFAGLSMMTKYYTAMLLLPMLLFMLLYSETRAQFRKLPVYYGLLVFFLICLPHTIWLFSHDFVTVMYAVNRVNDIPSWTNHIYYPLQFAWQQIEVFIPAFVLMLILVLDKPKKYHASESYDGFNKRFLFMMAFGPYLLTILLSAIIGMKLRAGWGQPLLTFWGLFFLAWLKPKITHKRLVSFISLSLIIFTITAIAYCIALVRASEPSSANFPGKNIAKQLTQEWHETYHTSLKYVVGPRWLAGNIAFYSDEHPRVYIDADKKLSPWIDEKEILQNGALFVWDPTEEYQMPFDKIRARFPKLGTLKVLHFTWMRNKTMAPVVISVAFLPPATRACRHVN